MKKLLLVCVAVGLAACAAAVGETTLVGSWVEPIAGLPGVQGIKLEAGGKASSINMATLQYETWTQDGENLVLTGKSIGNGQTIDFTDTLKIEKLTPEDLVLSQNDVLLAYTRQE